MDFFEMATTSLVVVGIIAGALSLAFILYLMFEEPIKRMFRKNK